MKSAVVLTVAVALIALLSRPVPPPFTSWSARGKGAKCGSFLALFEPGPVDPLQLHSKTGPTAHDAFDPGLYGAFFVKPLCRRLIFFLRQFLCSI